MIILTSMAYDGDPDTEQQQHDADAESGQQPCEESGGEAHGHAPVGRR